MKPRCCFCFFAALPDAGPCEGRLVKCHLVAQGSLRKEFPHGAIFVGGVWQPLRRALTRRQRKEQHPGTPYRSLERIKTDPRSWVWGCGGMMGNAGHHGEFDGYKLVVPRGRLPAGVEEFCAELGLGWWLERRYGPLGRSEGAV